MSKVIPSTTFGHVPDSTLSVESKIFDIKLKLFLFCTYCYICVSDFVFIEYTLSIK